METTAGLLERLKRTRGIVRLVMIVERLWPLVLPLVIICRQLRPRRKWGGLRGSA